MMAAMRCALLLCLCCAVLAAKSPPDNRVEDLVLSTVTREIDLKTPLVKQKVTMVIENQGSKPVNSVLYTVEPLWHGKVAYVGAQVGKEGVSMGVVEERPLPQHDNADTYRVAIPSLSSGASVILVVDVIVFQAITPFPTEITQNDNQLVKFIGNSYVFSPYLSKTQSTTVTLPTSNIESFTRVAPTNHAEDTLTYGPYSDVMPFSFGKVEVHFENSGPFLMVAELERIIEVSHWGNIAVEEHVHIKHVGAVLKGSFSRYDFQRNPNSGPSSVKSYITLLPSSAEDIYYRDEIGNISTSNARVEEDFVSLELRPRFPLFGGWQTRYYYGYNVPSYEYLFHQDSQYILKMRFVDHILDDQLIQRVTLKIILPEGVRNVDFHPPLYKVDERPRELKLTYLDTVGRPVVICETNNLVEQHIQDFELHYSFEGIMLLQEPLLIVAALYIFFLSVIVIVRLDFSITKDVALLARQQASVIIESVLSAHDKRAALVPNYFSCISSFKNTQDTKVFNASKKSLDDKFKSLGERVLQLTKELQQNDADSNSKVQEVQKKMTEVKTLLDNGCYLAEKVVVGSLPKEQYVKENKTLETKVEKLLQDVRNIVQTL